MKKFLLFFAVAALALLAAACSGYKYDSVKGDPLKTRIYTLDNGLKVYMSVNREEPRIQTYIVVNVGGKNDPSETTGLAHYFEHLMFKGTESFGTSDYAAEKPLLDRIEELFEVYRKTSDEAVRAELYRRIDSLSYEASKYSIPNEYDKLMAAIGSTGTNANTSMDRTVYIENIPSNQAENWAKIQADRFKHIVIRGFHTELETIYEEKNMSLTRDDSKAYYAIGEALFPNHPYGTQSVLGTQEHLKNPSITNVKKYHEQYYVPNNMAICLAGDFDPDKMIALIDKYFGDMQPNEELPKLDFEPEAPITKPVVKEVFGPEAEHVTLAWRADKAASEDTDYSLLAAEVLCNGKAGLMDLDLNQAQKVLTSFATNMPQADYGAVVLRGYPKEGQTLEQVRDLMLAEVAKLRDGDFDETLLQATINNQKVSLMRWTESNEGRVMLFVNSFYQGIPWADQVDELNRLGSITKEDLVAWVREKMGDENYAVIYKRQGVDPDVQKMPKPQLTPIEMNRDVKSDFLAEIQNTPVAPIEPVFVDFDKEMEIFRTDSGLEVLYKKNEINDLFSLTYLFDTGTFNDPEFNYAFPYMELLGTTARTAAQIAAECYDIACSYNISAGQSRSYVTFSGLSEHMGRVMDIFEHLVADAQGNEEVLANYKADILKSRSDAKLNQAQNFNALQRYAMFGGEMIRRVTLTDAQVEALSSEELLGKIRELMTKQHTILYYGPMGRKELLAQLAEHHPVAGQLEPLSSEHFAFRPTPEDRVYLSNYDANQIYYLQYANLGGMFDPAYDADVRLYNEYTSGSMNSIVFQEMREARSLAYSAYTYWVIPSYDDENYIFIAGIATQNDKMVEAIDAFSEIINDMPESQAAFDLAKESMLSNLRTGRTGKAAVLWAYVNNRDLGLDEDRNKAVYEKLQAMTLEDLREVQQQWIKDRRYFYCILGDLDDLDTNYLRRLGPVQVLSQEEIFGY